MPPKLSRPMVRLLALLGALPAAVVLLGVLYMLGMTYLEGNPRGFWASLEWASETLSTTGYGADSRWQHPVMVLFVMFTQIARDLPGLPDLPHLRPALLRGAL